MVNQLVMFEGKVLKMTEKDILHHFRNIHLTPYLQGKVDALLFKELKPEEEIGFKTVAPLIEGQLPSRVKITAKQGLEQAIEKMESNKKVIDAIDKLISKLK